jgi:hypothetical protein
VIGLMAAPDVFADDGDDKDPYQRNDVIAQVRLDGR